MSATQRRALRVAIDRARRARVELPSGCMAKPSATVWPQWPQFKRPRPGQRGPLAGELAYQGVGEEV
jgi:hypothetical protein